MHNPTNPTAETVTLTSLWNEVLQANAGGRLYPDPPKSDVERDERIDTLAVEGLIDAAYLDGASGWRVVLPD